MKVRCRCGVVYLDSGLIYYAALARGTERPLGRAQEMPVMLHEHVDFIATYTV